VTDCSGLALELGDANIPKLGEVTFFARELSPIEMEEIMRAGFTLNDIAVGKIIFSPEATHFDAIKSINDLVAMGKTKPDAIRFASSGNGSSSHLAMDVLRHMTGMQYLHIPYRGGGPALIDVMSGEVDVTMLPISESMPYVRDGRVIALGQTGVTRSTIAKDMPTIEEAGVKGYASTTWYMVLGPANLPANVVSFMQTQLANVLQMPDLRDKVQAAGVNIINGDSVKAKAFLDAEYKKWAALIKASGTVIE
jgi:tripartite-type tricarboxylate transporter receptor subunit TctC